MSNKNFEISKRIFFLGLIGVLLLSSIISYGLISAISVGGLTGPQGEVGPEGPQGEVGPPGPPGVNVVERQTLPDVKNIGTTVQNLGRIIIDVPTTGYVVLILTATVVTLGDQTSCRIGLATTDSSFDLHRTEVGVIDGTSNQRNIYSAASHAAVSVLPGSHTFYVNAQKSTVFNLYEVNIGDIFVSAVFYSNVN
ncbi:hypothetical protein E2P61_05040 [Candidatus Bathyarchaeota archaeon]|nr:hypothetical protein E2P61_05040 [Candidatus Bathyarchaeota archaeon]